MTTSPTWFDLGRVVALLCALANTTLTGCASQRSTEAAPEPRMSIHAEEAGIETGFLFRTLDVGDTQSRYAVYVPRAYAQHGSFRKKWPAIVFLHGRGECGTDGQRQIAVGLGHSILLNADRWPCIVIFPQKPTMESSWLDHESLVLATLDAAMRERSIDPDRIALTGLSQGGCGTWEIAASNPSRFRAIAPICGYVNAPNVPERVANLPIWAFHGLKDDVVTPDRTQKVVDEVRKLQAQTAASTSRPVRLTLYPDANHNSWDAAYADAELPGWLLAR